MSKFCRSCKVEKPLSEYYKNKTYGAKGVTYYPNSNCKVCHKKKTRDHSRKPETKRKTRLRPPLSQRPIKKIKTWTDIKKRLVKRNRELRQTVPHYRMKNILYRRLHHALKGKAKTESTMKLIGCSAEKVTKWIESQFTNGMKWENIEIDHMMPCAHFNLENPEEQKACFHYTNLQPLLKKDNRSKTSKIVHNMKWLGNEWYIKGYNDLYRSRRCSTLNINNL